MAPGVAEAIEVSGLGGFPMDVFVPSPPPLSASPLPSDLLRARRRQLQLVQPGALATAGKQAGGDPAAVRVPAPRPAEAPPALAPQTDTPLPDAPSGDFAHQVERQLPFLRNAARYWHRDKAGADDLVQDTVVRALANAHLWQGDQPESNFRGWLFTIMRNAFLAGRARARRGDTALDAIAAAAECVPAVASRPEARLMMRDVERGLSRLPMPQRTAIRLVGVDGCSYEEAALLMGTSVASVRCHLSRGRARLRELVDGNTASPPRAVPAAPARPAARRLAPRTEAVVQPEYA